MKVTRIAERVKADSQSSLKTGASYMTEQAISPLRRRMMEDMTMRKVAQKTQHDYSQGLRELPPGGLG
jgi:hypothetical protein